MLEEKYKRANEIQEEMWRLKNESNMLLKNFRGRYLCSIKPKVNRELKKQSHCIIVESDGDHLSMCSDFFKNKSGNRTQYNLILNPSPDLKYSKDCLKNRTWSNYDMYPTVLAAMGVKIEGNRLGLGTDLFSNEPTVFEEFGYDYVNKELAKKSEFYNKRILSPNGEKIAMHNTDDNQKYA